MKGHHFILFTFLQFCVLLIPAAFGIQSGHAVGEDLANTPAPQLWGYSVALSTCDDQGKLDLVFCGGSLIQESVVLTAGHCISGLNPARICIIHGARNLTEVMTSAGTTDEPASHQILRIKEMIVHPLYKQVAEDEFSITGDVGMIFLDGAVPQPANTTSWVATNTSNPGFALLPNPKQKWDGRNFKFVYAVLGWGIDENATDAATAPGQDPEASRLNTLQVTMGLALPAEECRAQPSFTGVSQQPNDTWCGAWFPGLEALFSSKSAIPRLNCKGDSGGPAVIPGTIVSPFGFQGDVQIGIVSYGPKCPFIPVDDRVSPNVYVDVAQYVDWIHSEMTARNITPLSVATSPLRSAYRDPVCSGGADCYDENVLTGESTTESTTNSTTECTTPSNGNAAIECKWMAVVLLMLLFNVIV